MQEQQFLSESRSASGFSALLLIFVSEALSKEVCVGLPREQFYAHDLCLIAETEE